MVTSSSPLVLPVSPVVVFDSGIGGMSLFLELKKRVPCLPLLYVADTAHFPYGNKSPHYITHLTNELCRSFVSQGAQAIICGCNTASSVALPSLRGSFDIPLLGVIEPAAEHIIADETIQRLGIIGTKATIERSLHRELIHKKRPDIEVIGQACPLLASSVELGFSSKQKVDLLTLYLSSLMRQDIDTLLLACTHYNFLLPYIKALLPKTCRIIDTTKTCIDSFLQNYSFYCGPALAESSIATTGNARRFKRTLRLYYS